MTSTKLHRKLKIEQHEPQYYPTVNSGVPTNPNTTRRWIQVFQRTPILPDGEFRCSNELPYYTTVNSGVPTNPNTTRRWIQVFQKDQQLLTNSDIFRVIQVKRGYMSYCGISDEQRKDGICDTAIPERTQDFMLTI
jgi:hypothetical protein